MKDYLKEKLFDMIDRIAYANADFYCSTCLETKDDILDIARCTIGYEYARELENHWEEIMEQYEDTE